MGLQTTKEMFAKAYEGGYAIGAFNFNNMEVVQSIARTAAEEKAPFILQASASAIKFAGMAYVIALAKAVEAENPDAVFALHLDHGEDFEICKACVDAGFTSVMFDGSKYPLEENIRRTKEVVDYAHAHGAVVEGELGRLAGVEDDVNVSAEDAMYTDPAEAERFVKETGVDSLAIAIGTSHGAFKFKGEARLRLDILEEVARRLPGFPIVLHGASSVPGYLIDQINAYGGQMDGAKGVPAELLRKAASMAVCKINIDSDIRMAMTAAVRKSFVESPANFDPRKYMGPARDEIRNVVIDKLRNALGASGKA
ncbi:MAG: class II fructose-1,6-bisphosphate aldolase [Clostridia bacterium]|nr:class II fructose-1,6-bisphosphate aldolase [Clostridia bacterium]